MASSRVFALAASVVTLGLAGRADAYCRTAVCDDATSAVCVPALDGDCGTPLFWPTGCVGFSMQKDASTQVPLATATAIFDAAFANWVGVQCPGGGSPNIVVDRLDPTGCSTIEYNAEAGNANAIQFDDAAWPYDDGGSTLALTTVTYNLQTGEIYDADMELNSANVAFSTGDASVQFDLASIAQHETGHFLGLAHSPDGSATMYASYMMGDTSLRSLEADDIAAICAAYPPSDARDPSCDPTPRRGLSLECGGTNAVGGEDSSSGCSAAPGGSAPGEGFGAIFAGALALAAARLRTRRGRA